MNKTEFIKAAAEKANVSVTEMQSNFEAFIETVTETIAKGDAVALTGIATIELRKKAAREGINPLTKEKIKIKASNAPAVKFSAAYKAKFN